MRRLLRWAFGLFAAVSAIVFACDAACWACACWRGAGVSWRSSANDGCCESVHAQTSVALFSNGFGVDLYRDDCLYPPAGVRPDLSDIEPPYQERTARWWRGGPPILEPWHEIGPGVAPRLAERLCLWCTFQHAVEGPEGSGGRYLSRSYWHLDLRLPHWLICAMAGAVPVRLLMKRLRCGSRRRQGRCPRCGYDLQATPGRCPECGFVSGTKGAMA